MMRILLLTLSSLLLASFQQVDDSTRLKVIKVVGTIVVKDTQKLLTTGDEITPKIQLEFKTTDARAAVISLDNKIRYELTDESSSINDSNIPTAKMHLIPSVINISSRAGALLNIVDIQNHFTGNFAVINRTELRIDPRNFPMNDTHLFYLRYIYKGEEINKKLDYKNDTLIIDKVHLYQVDNKPILSPDDNKVTLFYKEGNKSITITEFRLIFPDNNVLKQEIDVFWNELVNKTFNEKVNEVVSYINEFYGRPGRNNVLIWLKDNF